MVCNETATTEIDTLTRHDARPNCFNRQIPPGEIIERIDAVDAPILARTARRLIGGGPPTLTALGQIAEVEPYDRLSGRFA